METSFSTELNLMWFEVFNDDCALHAKHVGYKFKILLKN